MDDFDFEAPSFSLGIDLDDDDHTVLIVDDSDPEPTADESIKRNVVRRRRTTAAANAASSAPDCNDEEDEEIEDFSSQDDLDYALGDTTSVRNQAVCSTSKTSLRAQGSVVVKPSRKLQSDDLTNCKGETCGDRIKIPKLTVSPVRKFQLVDSDSEDLTDFVKKDTVPKTAKTSGGLTEPSGKRSGKESSGGSHQNDDLWNDFLSSKSFTVSTPVLDEVCEEYFHTQKEMNDGKYTQHCARMSNRANVTGKLADMLIQQNSGLQGSVPPAHRYFFHNDMRIQSLVRSRLHNFYPLDVLGNNQDELLGTPNIDYRSQFNHGGASTSRKQTKQKSNVTGNSTKGRRKNKHNVENVSQVSESWVNPRASASTPKDAGQRRVRADGSSDGGCPKKASSMGRWFTDSDGKRVYVSTSGQELTGRLAYMHYKKESGGFKKSRKKAAAKKK